MSDSDVTPYSHPEQSTLGWLTEGAGHLLSSIPSKSLDLFSYGFKRLLDGVWGGQHSGLRRLIDLPVGLATMALGGVPLVLASPLYFVGHALKSWGAPEFEYRTETSLPGEAKKIGQLKIFSLNAALGDKVMLPANFAGTGFTDLTLRERSDRILQALDREAPDLIALQEVFSPTEARHIADRLAERGYDVVFNSGHAMWGLAGYNSGLLTAVKRSSGLTLTHARYRDFKAGELPDLLAAKGAQLLDIADSAGNKMVFVKTHLQASSRHEVAIRDQQMAEIVAWIGDERRVVIAGDMNCFDRHIAQASHWIKGVLNGYQDGWKPSHAGYLGVVLLGSGVHSHRLGQEGIETLAASQYDKAKEVGSTMSDADLKAAIERAFAKRHADYRYGKGNSIKDHAAAICRARGKNPPWQPLLQTKEVLSIRDRSELISEYAIAQYDGTKSWEELQQEAATKSDDELTRASAESANRNRAALEEVYAVTSTRNALLEEVTGRNLNDRIFTKGFEGSSYLVAHHLRHLSDHAPLIGTI